MLPAKIAFPQLEIVTSGERQTAYVVPRGCANVPNGAAFISKSEHHAVRELVESGYVLNSAGYWQALRPLSQAAQWRSFNTAEKNAARATRDFLLVAEEWELWRELAAAIVAGDRGRAYAIRFLLLCPDGAFSLAD
jgi:hypothetical protein